MGEEAHPEPAGIPCYLPKALQPTPQRKSCMILRKINVEKCPKGKRAGLERCYCWFCLETTYKILDLDRTLWRLSPCFLDRTHSSCRCFYFKRLLNKMILWSPLATPPPTGPRPTSSPRLPRCFLQKIQSVYFTYFQ